MLFEDSVGGLATGLASFFEGQTSAWVGWPGIARSKINDEEKENITRRLTRDNYHPVFLSRADVENYYHGFANKTIWPLFHYFPLYSKRRKSYWTAYARVNHKFCDVVAAAAEPGDIIWIHDYQLMLLPALIRERIPDATIGFFLHIPFPAFDVFRLLPWREGILRGLLGADLIGFHTYGYVSHFLDSVRRLMGYENTWGQMYVDNRIVKADVFPMGINYERVAATAASPAVQKEARRIREHVGDRKIILSVDRLDYTKGIVERLEAFQLFMAKNPSYRDKVTLIMIMVPSRTAVGTYAELKRRVDEHVGRIDGKYGAVGRSPIWYLYRSLPFDKLLAYYVAADVALVTPLRDGMNLVAKEFVASKSDGQGALILSDIAGAAEELGEAIIVNPYDMEAVASAIRRALDLSPREKAERTAVMQKRIRRYDVNAWAKAIVQEIKSVKAAQRSLATRRVAGTIERDLIAKYRAARRRLLLFDYDGTLVLFAGRPEYARPDNELLRLLRGLNAKLGNEVVILSGRDRDTLRTWLGDLDITLVAEHGSWVKEHGGEWESVGATGGDWKKEMMPVLERYADRTPGSFIEEKDFSLVMHYRKTDPDLAAARMGELKSDLFNLTANIRLDILEGNKIIEVRDAGVNKGSAALHFLEREKYDFVLAVGDDYTDEDTFAALPDSAYTIKVGLGPSQAKYNLDSVSAVRSLLKKLTR